jgi:chromosome segregation ATPase
MEAVRRPEPPQQDEARPLAGARSVEARELMSALEAVEGQRDELQQQLEAERAAVAEAQRRLRQVEQDKEDALAAAKVRAAPGCADRGAGLSDGRCAV